MSLFNDLSTLESAGLIRVSKMEPDLEYNFLHTLVQDAAYASLLESDRKRLHLAVADAIESLYPDRRKRAGCTTRIPFSRSWSGSTCTDLFPDGGGCSPDCLCQPGSRDPISAWPRPDMLHGDEEIARLYTGLGEALYRQSRFDVSLQAMRRLSTSTNQWGE